MKRNSRNLNFPDNYLGIFVQGWVYMNDSEMYVKRPVELNILNANKIMRNEK